MQGFGRDTGDVGPAGGARELRVPRLDAVGDPREACGRERVQDCQKENRRRDDVERFDVRAIEQQGHQRAPPAARGTTQGPEE